MTLARSFKVAVYLGWSKREGIHHLIEGLISHMMIKIFFKKETFSFFFIWTEAVRAGTHWSAVERDAHINRFAISAVGFNARSLPYALKGERRMGHFQVCPQPVTFALGTYTSVPGSGEIPFSLHHRGGILRSPSLNLVQQGLFGLSLLILLLCFGKWLYRSSFLLHYD